MSPRPNSSKLRKEGRRSRRIGKQRGPTEAIGENESLSWFKNLSGGYPQFQEWGRRVQARVQGNVPNQTMPTTIIAAAAPLGKCTQLAIGPVSGQ
jgi:hypothetical protein